MSYNCHKCGKELVENNEKNLFCPNCEPSINKTKDPIEEMPNLKADFELFKNQSNKDSSYIKEELKVLKEELSSGKKTYKTISLKKVHVFSLAAVLGLTGAIIGFIEGMLFMSILSIIMTPALLTLFPQSQPLLAGGGIILILSITSIFGAGGFIVGAIYALVYNFVASATGGLKGDVDLDKREY
jgi:hypothetical protein